LVGCGKAIVTLGLLPLVYSCLNGPPNDFAFCFAGMACNASFFLVLALLPYIPAVWSAIPLTALGQVSDDLGMESILMMRASFHYDLI